MVTNGTKRTTPGLRQPAAAFSSSAYYSGPARQCSKWRKGPGRLSSGIKLDNVADDRVFAQLQRLKMNPSPLCEDTTFVRRVSLDLTGLLPTT
jgi:Protein of unknown function (DUF1549)